MEDDEIFGIYGLEEEGKSNDKDKDKEGLPIRHEEELTKKYHFKSMKETKDVYYYDDSKGIYVNGAEWLIEQQCVKYDPEIKTKEVTDIKNRIIWANYTDRSEFDPDIEWLCCKNVMVNLGTGEVKEHGPEFMATVQLPHVYLHRTPHVPRPYRILQFLQEVMGADNTEMVLDFIAYCLWRDFRFHRCLLLNGNGRNGKGVTTELITRFLGHRNVSNESLHRLLENRFASANLFGKMANIDADLSSEALRQTGLLKKITGADEITGEFKFKTAFSFRNYAKLIFSANKIPPTPDDTDAFFARLLIVNFPNQYLGNKANPYLIDELATESEMSAFLSLILKRLPRVLKNGISNSQNSTIEDNYLKYMQSSNPIALFIEMAIQRTGDSNDHVTKDELYQSYERFCWDKGLAKESSGSFKRQLKSEGFDDDRIRKDGVRTYIWKNIILRDYTKVEDEDQETLTQ